MKRIVALLSLGLYAAAASAQQASPYEAAKPDMIRRTEAAKKAAMNDPDRRVWDFVFADKKAKTVTVLACATTIRHDDPAEFFVSPVAGGKDYESLSVTFAKPADVQAAMRFIGLDPGRPVDPRQNRFWARGPRTVMTVEVGDAQPVRAEMLVLDTTTGKPLPASGLVYTGSTEYAANGTTRRVADDTDGGPIAPTYNEPSALFDVPTQAPQSEVYGRRKPSPAFAAKAGEPIEITITAAAGADAVPTRDAWFWLKSIDGKTKYDVVIKSPSEMINWGGPTSKSGGLPELVARLAKEADGTSDLFVNMVVIEPDVPVIEVRKFYAVLEAVEKDRGIKLDALPSGELFHRAFFPDPAWRDRSTRLGEPWELFLNRDADQKIVAKLERQTEDPDATPRVRVQTTPPADPAAMAKYVQANASQWSRALFVYPPADLTYGELLAWTKPVADALPRVFVFPPDGAATRSSE